MADTESLTYVFMRSHPAEAAKVLDAATAADAVDLFSRVPARIGGAVLALMSPGIAARTLSGMPRERATELLGSVAAPPSVALLRQVAEPRRSELISGLPLATSLKMNLLLGYPDDSVGACVDPGVIATGPDALVGEVLERVRHARDTVDRVCALDEAGRLVGWAPLDALLRAPVAVTLGSLLHEAPDSLSVTAPLEGARAHPGWMQASTLPVVERDGRFVGILTRDALDRALRRGARGAPRETTDDALAVVVVRGYWRTLTGILEAATSILPPVEPVGGSEGER
jgi:magnesium transporter